MIKAVYLGDNTDATCTNIEYMEKYGGIEYAVFSESDEAFQYMEKNPECIVFFEHGVFSSQLEETCRRLRGAGLGGAFVVITAEDDCDIISNMYRNGISAVLVKPFDYDAFSVVLDYYREHLDAACSGKLTSNLWVPLSKVFTRKESDLAKSVLETLDKGDFTAGEIATGLKQPVFLVQQCINELLVSRDVASYIRTNDDGRAERVFSKNQL